MAIDPKDTLLMSHEFRMLLGTFYGVWNSIEIAMGCGIKKELKLTSEETHILTAGMEFGRLIRILRNFVYSHDHKNKSQILKALGKIQNESKRNVFAHSFMISSRTHVTFINRSMGGDYEVTNHPFSIDEFRDHVQKLIDAGKELEAGLAIPEEEFRTFAFAALSAAKSSPTSPTPSSAKAKE